MTHRTIAIGGLLATAAAASAQLTAIGPFTGQYQETFAGLPNYLNGGAYNSLDIMGGEATLTTSGTAFSWAPQLNIYNSTGPATFYIAGAPANTIGSSNSLGLYNMSSPVDVTLTFNTPVNYFGGYFADIHDVPDNVEFYDASNVQIGSGQTVGDGSANLTWNGWYSSDAIQTVTFTDGMATAMGDLQAGTPVLSPEPGAIAVFGFGLIGLLVRRRR